MSAFLWWRRNHSKRQLSGFLLTRGLWLVFLELTVMRFAYNFNFSARYPVLLLVLWALGACMIVLSALIALPLPWLAVLSSGVIALHNCLDGVQAAQFGAAAPIWNIVHAVGAFPFAGVFVVVGYPLTPWFAVMAAGFCFARVFELEAPKRQRILLWTGITATLAFVMLRLLNSYGDPAPWHAQASTVKTLLSFLNTTKYPPSLLYLLMTLGPALLVLAFLDRRQLKTVNPFIVFGRVPLFYFILHFYAAHAAMILLAWLRYGSAARPFLFVPPPSMGGPRQLFPADFGYDLWVVYAVWAVIVIGFNPACRWYGRIKAEKRVWWLSYL